MSGRRACGFTLVELMVALVITSLLAATIVTLLAHHRDHTRRLNAQTLWSSQSRAALSTLSRDVRQARQIEVRGGRLALGVATAEGAEAIVYYLEREEGGARQRLIRQGEQGRRVLATSVERFDLARRPGRLEVTLEFAESFGTYRGAATHRATVALMLQSPPGGES